MTELVKISQSDSTNDGSGASTIMEPPQVDNVLDDAILIKVTQSLNNSTNVSNINVTTPTGYTLLRDLRDNEVRSWLYYKQSTGSETIPTVTSDTSAEWTCTTAVVTDVDWANGGVAQQVSNTAGGDTQSPDLTTQSGGGASVIVCFFSLERRICQGFRYPNTRPETVFKGAVSTGTGEGVDNASGAGFDFISDRSTVWEGPFWETNGGGDSLSINVEVVTQGNIVPLQSSTYIEQSAPTNTLQTTMNWCREICNSGIDLDGDTLQTWTFDASTANTSNDRVTVTGHGMDESMVVRLSANGNTPPTGLADDTFYYVEPVSTNEIRFRSVNEDTDAVSDYYADGTTKRAIVSISAAGSGTITLTEARMINAAQGPLDIFRPNNGSAANTGTFSGNYIGDGGYNQNWVATSQRFNQVFDATDETITLELQVNGAGRLDRVVMTLIDEDGDWMNWYLYKKPISVNNTGQLIYQFQVDKSGVQAKKYQSFGTFDATRIRYLVIAGRGNNTSVSRFNAINSASSRLNLGGPFTAINGQNADFNQLVELAQTYTPNITKPSDLQIVSTIPISFGNGVTDVSFVDSEKSLAFPPLADGVNTFQNYLDNIGVTIDATASSTVKITNSQVGASVPYSFDVTATSGATVDLTGNSYVFGNISLDSDISYNRQLFVGGEGITDNNSEIRNSTFIVNTDLGANNGMIEWNSSTDIEDSTFELSAGTSTGHAIVINSTGTYTFTNISALLFGADGTNTAAVYNNSGGAVTINVSGGTIPTVRNGAGASTTIIDLSIINVTNNAVYSVDAISKFVVDTDTVTTFTIDGIIPKVIETTGSGTTTILGINNAKLTTTSISGTGTLTLGDGLNPSSNWSYSSGTNTLTLNGTEGDLLGLRGLAEVDYADAGGKTVFTVNDQTKIVISGTGDLTLDSDIEQLVCGIANPANNNNTLTVQNNGRLQVGKAKVVGGFTIYSSGPAIVFSNDSLNANFTVATGWENLRLDNGSRLDWYGGEIQSIGLLLPYPGSEFRTYSKEAVFVSVSSSLQSTRPEAYIRMQTSDQVINGFVNKFGILLMIGKPTTFTGYEPISSGSAIDMSNQSTSSSYYDFEDLVAGKGNTRDIGGKHDTWIRLLNTNLGSDITVTAQQSNPPASSDQKYLVENKKSLLLTYVDENGSIIQGAKVYMRDTNNGARLTANQVGTNASYTNDYVYTGNSTAAGLIDFTSVTDAILLSVYHHSNTNGNTIYDIFDSRGNQNNKTDLFTFKSISYNHSIASATLELKGIGTLNQEQVLITDFTLTQTNKTTVDAYTELETPEKLYDRAKSYLYDNYAGETSLIASRQGTAIDMGSFNLVIDATASSAFALSGNTVTIKASTFTGDITTTGTVTLSNGATVIGTIIDTNGTISNTSLTLTGLKANTEIRVFTAGTTTEIAGVENSSTSESFIISESSVDIVIHHIDYVYQKIEGANTSSNLTLPIQQRLDRNYENP